MQALRLGHEVLQQGGSLDPCQPRGGVVREGLAPAPLFEAVPSAARAASLPAGEVSSLSVSLPPFARWSAAACCAWPSCALSGANLGEASQPLALLAGQLYLGLGPHQHSQGVYSSIMTMSMHVYAYSKI